MIVWFVENITLNTILSLTVKKSCSAVVQPLGQTIWPLRYGDTVCVLLGFE